jgi:hypothetical protein
MKQGNGREQHGNGRVAAGMRIEATSGQIAQISKAAEQAAVTARPVPFPAGGAIEGPARTSKHENAGDIASIGDPLDRRRHQMRHGAAETVHQRDRIFGKKTRYPERLVCHDIASSFEHRSRLDSANMSNAQEKSFRDRAYRPTPCRRPGNELPPHHQHTDNVIYFLYFHGCDGLRSHTMARAIIPIICPVSAPGANVAGRLRPAAARRLRIAPLQAGGEDGVGPGVRLARCRRPRAAAGLLLAITAWRTGRSSV